MMAPKLTEAIGQCVSVCIYKCYCDMLLIHVHCKLWKTALLYLQSTNKFCTTWSNVSVKLQPLLYAVKDRELLTSSVCLFTCFESWIFM